MREWISLFEENEKPWIDWHQAGEFVVLIDMFYVPPGMRGKGIGKTFYQNWESRLPKSVKLVRLMAADYGDGAGMSNQFWERMGFEYNYTGDNLPYEVEQMMWKGVNGHPTPPAIESDGDD